MSNLAYPACIRTLYDSEIFGEAVFRALGEVAKSPREKYMFGTLLQLETETKARLRPFLFKHGLTLSETVDVEVVGGVVAGYTAHPWLAFAGGTIPVIQDFFAQFKAIAEVGPEEDQQVLQSMIHHEAAILKWLTMESVGSTEGSLDDVIAQLQYPLPILAGE